MSILSEPIFLVGAERSGTTLLRLMLRSHSQLSWCNEFEYAVDLISEEKGWPQLNNYHQWLATDRIFQATKFTIDPSLDYPHLVNSFLVQKKTREQKSLVGATVHRNFHHLLKIWSDAKFIHIVRDGRDVARSCIGMGWAGNVWTGVERWIEVENSWATMKSTLESDRWIEITYESLIAEPTKTLEKLCDFIGINFEPKMLQYDQSTTYDAPNLKLIYQWKRKLSAREIQLVESRISQMLLERNYPLSGLPLITVNNNLANQLRLQSWWKKIQFRVQQIGLPLFIADYVSRRFNIQPWQKNIKLKINEIVRSQLK